MTEQPKEFTESELVAVRDAIADLPPLRCSPPVVSSEALTYMSFATKEKCLGVVILEGALDAALAAITCHQMGLNPGGEVMAVSCSPDDGDVPLRAYKVMAANTNRLIPAEEARRLFEGNSLKELEEENEEAGRSSASAVHPDRG